MLKTLGSIESIIRPGKGRVGVDDNSSDNSSYNNEHSPQCSRREHQGTHELIQLRL